MIFTGDRWFVVVTKEAVSNTGIKSDFILKRVLSRRSEQKEAEDWRGQPAVSVDDGNIMWVVTFTSKVAPDGKKRMAYVVEGNRYQDESVIINSKFWRQ